MSTDRSFVPPGEPQPLLPTAHQPRTGVFICECGGKISSILDVDELTRAAANRPEVDFAEHAPFWCSQAGRDRMQEAVRGKRLDRVVVAGCSARTHRKMFRDATRGAGMNPELLGMVNIREGCAWPHRAAPEKANGRARDQIAMEVAHIDALTPGVPVEARINPAALVIGGGVAGMTAALELADGDIPVTLLERSASLGGSPSEAAGDITAELIAAVEAHPGVRVQLDASVTAMDGSVGGYRVSFGSGDGAEWMTAGPFGAVVVATGAPDEDTDRLATLLRLPRDTRGHLSELRVRLRPVRYLERGIYVCGGVHHPCDPAMAQFQAFSAASRALRHLRTGSRTLTGPRAQVDAERCTGCNDCARSCPFFAITMLERPLPARGYGSTPNGAVSLASIDPLLCTGCGNCVSVCPVDAASLSGWSDAQLSAQMQVALDGGTAPRILVLACEWSGHAAAELAGAEMRSYPAEVRMVRLDCSGRLESGLIFDAFEMGADGVLVLGCAPRLCHYERGNERATAAFLQAEELTRLMGVDSRRLRLAWAPPDDGEAFAELVTEFAEGALAATREEATAVAVT
ncbi:MAG: hydrogenase iron-sulfur subunit [Acidobacteriota bacterium]|jgi:heterodisulfide reductase subunit A-like polyferredoxin/coenzyme F420-reducing hydrogenase delta subunit